MHKKLIILSLVFVVSVCAKANVENYIAWTDEGKVTTMVAGYYEEVTFSNGAAEFYVRTSQPVYEGLMVLYDFTKGGESVTGDSGFYGPLTATDNRFIWKVTIKNADLYYPVLKNGKYRVKILKQPYQEQM